MKKMTGNKLAVFIIFLLVFVFALDAVAQQIPNVTAIEVKGIRRIEEGAIKAKISQKTGAPLSHEKTTEDIKTIFKMGYFEDVNVQIEPFEGGVRVLYIVNEKPTIVRVEFQGNNEFKDEELKEKIGLAAGAISDVSLINDNANKLRVFYEDEGYFLAQIVPVLKKEKDGEAAVTFQITEGDKVKIKTISFEGNKKISTSKIKKAIKTTERGMFSWVLGTGYYKRQVMKEDLEKIRDLYYNNGYLKMTVGEPKLDLIDNKKKMNISIAISEGDQFRVSDFDIAGNKVYKKEELLKLLKIKKGEVFSRETLKKDVTALSDQYANKGYALVAIGPDLKTDEEKKTVSITYTISEGEKYKIGRIDISGNTKTKDKVIRREIRLDEGADFDASALKRSYERLNNLQFFETIDMVPKPKAETKEVDLDVKVKEKPTGFISVGGGYSSIDSLIGMVDITQGNLFGTGQYVKLRGELGGKSSYYELSYKDPWFMDKPLTFGASVYNTKREYDNFDRKSTGAGVSFGKYYGEYWYASVGYNFEVTTINNIASDASAIVKDQEGKATTSKVTFTLARDSRDNYLDPLKGSRHAATLAVAGLGGTNAFLKTELETGWYFPVWETTTFHLKGTVGYATALFDKKLPLYERFYVGGIYTIRGLSYGYGGPRDVNGDPIGGVKEIVLNAEYIFPIFPEFKFKGVVFTDAGKAYGTSETFGSDLKYTAGTGIRWISPIGPIRIEWGYNLNKKDGESSSKIEFMFGSFF
ncbi:MAG: outer membrane protein assembly factor BamA [Nitrospiraceae bacterium]|nr:outer membrane protein assembly factor BamA [Nitrospiraceae bacterium]